MEWEQTHSAPPSLEQRRILVALWAERAFATGVKMSGVDHLADVKAAHPAIMAGDLEAAAKALAQDARSSARLSRRLWKLVDWLSRQPMPEK